MKSITFWHKLLAIFMLFSLIGGTLMANAQAPTSPEPVKVINTLGPTNIVRWSPKFTWLASSNYIDSLVSIWNVTNGELVKSLGISDEGNVVAMEWSPNGDYIASLHGNYRFQIWDTKKWENLLNFRLDSFIQQETYVSYLTSLVWSPDSRRIAMTVDYHLVIWDIGGHFSYISQNDFSADSAAWSPDGNKIAILTPEGSIKLLDGTSFNLLATFALPEAISKRMVYEARGNIIEWNPDGTRLAFFGNDFALQSSVMAVLDASTGENIIIEDYIDNNIQEIAWSPNDTWLAIAGSDSTVRVWNSDTYGDQEILKEHTDIVTSVDWSPDGRYLASSSLDGTIAIFEVPPDF